MDNDKQPERCQTCRFYNDVPLPTDLREQGGITDISGVCRRYPPTQHKIDLDGGGTLIMRGFPPTHRDEWCGEWNPKEADGRQPLDR